MEIQLIQKKIYEVRGQKIMFDFDLAELYDTDTKRLKEAVRRNISRFPKDFMFVLNHAEFKKLRSQFASSKRGGRRYLPFVFTEQGVAMLSGVLNSEKAIKVNIQIIRAFVFLRQYAIIHEDLSKKLKALERKFNKKFRDVYEAMNYLLAKEKKQSEQMERKRIGLKHGQ
jgi:hypothetical protein